MLRTKKSFKYCSDHTVEVLRKALTADQSFTSVWSEYKIISHISFDDKVHHFYINDQEMCRIYQNNDDVEKVMLHVGYRLDKNSDPSARAREHINSILATLAEDDWLPEIRLYWNKEQQCVFLGACDPAGPRVHFNGKHGTMALIRKTDDVETTHGFYLMSIGEDLWK